MEEHIKKNADQLNEVGEDLGEFQAKLLPQYTLHIAYSHL